MKWKMEEFHKKQNGSGITQRKRIEWCRFLTCLEKIGIIERNSRERNEENELFRMHHKSKRPDRQILQSLSGV